MSTSILGISAYYHDSAACLVRDGEILAAAQEERFTRKKHDAGFPHHAVAYCLREGGLDIAAVDYVGLLPDVHRNRIGAIGICGLSGMALTAASGDTRIKAVATASMYDMSRSISRSYKNSYTREQRQKVIDYLSQQRWSDAKSGSYALGYHEVPFDKNGQIIKGNRVLPDKLPVDADPVLTAFFNYYRTPRGFHPRSINSTTAWTATTPMSFFEFPMAANIDMIAPRPIMLVHGANAHSLYYSEDAYKAATNPKELVIVPDADHVDLYDDAKKIPFGRLEAFFKESLLVLNS